MGRDGSSGGVIRLAIIQPGKPVERIVLRGPQVPSHWQ